jgi:pimeloyl-ACP methyl ester carboxylesterase
VGHSGRERDIGWTWDRLPDRPVRRWTAGSPSAPVDVVVVPGLGAPGYLLPFARACASWARVHLLDLPGFGDRRTARYPSSLDDVAGVLRLWLAAVALERPVVIGHSTGAQAALHAAASGAHIDLLVLAGVTFPPQRRSLPRLVGPLWRSLYRESWRELAAVAPYYARGRGRVWTLLRSAQRDAPEALVRRLGERPVVVRGRRDPFSPADWSAALAGRPAATMPGAHNFPFTHPDATSAWLRSTVADRPGPRRASQE